MKKVIMVLIVIVAILSISVLAFADVTAEIIGKDIDSNGSIVVKVQYKIDGVEVQSRYPQENGKYYWVTRYSKENFTDMTDTQIKDRIDSDIKAFGEQLILKPFYEKQRADLITANTLFSNTSLQNVVGRKVTIATAKMIVDSDFDGTNDKEWIVDTEGNKVEKNYTPIISTE